MAASSIQIWVGIVGSLVTIIGSVAGVLNFQRRRDRSAAVGANFKDVVNSLASDNETLRMAAAILLRRFFDPRTEQGKARRAYSKEAVAVIAGLLRESKTGPLQKLLADGLLYAPSLSQADLQGCNLTGAYIGQKREKREKRTRAYIWQKGEDRTIDLTGADFFEADLTRASLRGASAADAVFYGATLVTTVLVSADLTNADFRDADLTNADFRDAKLKGAKFDGTQIDGAQFSGASDIPADVKSRLDPENPSR